MEQRGYGWQHLSNEERQALEYEAGLLGDMEFRIGKYEQDYTIEGHLLRNTYELGDTEMLIRDAVWGEAHIGDEPYDALLLELARTPLFRRLQSIEQLTLGKDHATMPNSMYFSRWEHIWGSLVFVRKMTEGRTDIDDRQRMVLQLRTLLSDVGHTAFSHLGDWMFQGTQGGEDMHDKDLKDILRVSGIEEMLGKYGFSVDETAFPDIEDWVECPAPDLCVDRVDYGFREILRWGSPSIPMNMHLQELHNPQEVFDSTPEGRLVMKSQKLAKYYAAGFSILPTEHWAHPVHRLQLQLFQSAVRSSVIDQVDTTSSHPRDALYAIDNSFMSHFQTWPMLHLQKTMKDIALTQRRIFMNGRRHDLNEIFRGIRHDDWQFPEFPDPIRSYTWQSEEFSKPYPPNIKIEQGGMSDDPPLSWNEEGLTVSLPPLKSRSIDPPVAIQSKKGTDTGPVYEVKRLSELDPSYNRYLAEQREMMNRSYTATVLMRPDVAQRIVQEHESDDALWRTLLQRDRDPEQLARTIKESEIFAAAHAFDYIRETDDQNIERYTESKKKLGHQGILFGL